MIPVFTHPACLQHDPGRGHPESPARLRAILERLRSEPGIEIRDAPPASRDALLGVHSSRYLDMLEATARGGGGMLDEDTYMNAESWQAAIGGAGAVLAAVRDALAFRRNGFAAVRPPGHHCLKDRAMGFCLLSNAVIGALDARAQGADRVLIVDWDVHHGNGTQALIQHEPLIRFISLHQWPHWPGTGRAEERGVGNITNLPMPPGLPPEEYVRALTDAIGKNCDGWKPNLVLISAGYDAMRGDPLGGFTLEP